MKITDIQVIEFRLPTRGHGTKWGYGTHGEHRDGVQSVTKVVTDEGATGYSAGGVHSCFYGARPEEVEAVVKPLLLGHDPWDRERLWHWMKGHRGISERLLGNIDCALWDLAGRATGMPVAKLLGGVNAARRWVA
jgi:L-alanine-DL-glutamate epimerase-like enolase superfamily enzyme